MTDLEKLAAMDAESAFQARIELWFMRDIDDEARRKLIGLCLGEGVAKEAKFHNWQMKCLRRILHRSGDLVPRAVLDEAVADEGPQPIKAPERKTCTGCKHLLTKWWKDYLDNDETDSGTSARCGAVMVEGRSRSITAYWSDNSTYPSWCPFLAKHGGGDAQD